MSEQSVNVPAGAPPSTPDEPARVAGGISVTRATDAESLPPRPGDDMQADPSLEGIPLDVIENVGAYDTDSAGGCG